MKKLLRISYNNNARITSKTRLKKIFEMKRITLHHYFHFFKDSNPFGILWYAVSFLSAIFSSL